MKKFWAGWFLVVIVQFLVFVPFGEWINQQARAGAGDGLIGLAMMYELAIVFFAAVDILAALIALIVMEVRHSTGVRHGS